MLQTTKEEDELRIRKGKNKRKRNIRIAICAAAVLCVGCIIFYALDGYPKVLKLLGIQQDVRVEPKATVIQYTPKGACLLEAVGDSVIIYDENGVTALNSAGEWKWNESCTFSAPAAVRCGEVLLLYDADGTNLYAFSGSGLLWKQVFTEGMIGVAAGSYQNQYAVLHNVPDYLSAATLLNMKKSAAAGNIEADKVFVRKFGSHYMTSAAISPDGTQLAVSGFSAEGSSITGITAFLRMSDGELFTTEQYDGQIYPVAEYLGNETLFLCSSDSLRMIRRASTASTKQDVQEELWNRNGGSKAILGAAALNGRYLAVAYGDGNPDSGSLSTVSEVKYYTESGKVKLSFEIEGRISGIRSYRDTVAFYTERTVYLYNDQGQLIGTYTAPVQVERIAYISDRELLVYGNGKIASVLYK